MPGEKEAVANAFAILAHLRLWPGSNVVVVNSLNGKSALREAVVRYASKLGIEDLHLHNEWCKPKANLVLSSPTSEPLKCIATAIEHAAKDAEIAFYIELELLARGAHYFALHPCDIFVVSGSSKAWFVWGPKRGGRWSML